MKQDIPENPAEAVQLYDITVLEKCLKWVMELIKEI